MWCAVAHARYVTPGRSADRCVPCTQIILEEAAYCDPGLVSEVYAKAMPPRRRCFRLTRRVLVCQSRAASEHAAVCVALYQHHPRLGQPLLENDGDDR